MNSFTITSFNSRGIEMTALFEDKPLLIKNLLSSSNISLIQETHSKSSHSKTLHSIFPTSDLLVVPGTGTAGGLCSAFPADSVALAHSHSSFYLSAFVENFQQLDLS